MPTTFYPSTLAQGPILDAAIYTATDGDTIVLPTGNAVWGAGGVPYYLTGAFTMVGSSGQTIIHIADDAPTNNGTINVWAPLTISGITIVGANTATRVAFGCDAYNGRGNGWRITNCIYSGQTENSSYFAIISAGTYGVIDNNYIKGAAGNSELILQRGPSNSWTTPSAWGTTGAVFVESNTFDGTGYVCDANANARMVVRYNTIKADMKIDGHGVASNTPARSVRWMEVYGNHWTDQAIFTAAMEFRGGSLRVFNNTSDNTHANSDFFFLTDYGYIAEWPNFAYLYQVAPTYYPIAGQIGVGQDPQAAHSEPAYVWSNTQNGAPWARTYKDLSPVTTTTNTSGYGPGTMAIGLTSMPIDYYPYNAIEIVGDTGRYYYTGSASGTLLVAQYTGATTIILEYPGIIQAIPASNVTVKLGSQPTYQKRSGLTTGVLTDAVMILSNRDFYADAGFDTYTGVSVGTTAQMNAFTPTVTGYGFWVTDQGSWNKTVAANTAGLLYTWSGSWSLAYTPYQYPYYWYGSGSASGANYIYKRWGAHPKFAGLALA